jgi:hypothetical protein
MLWTVMSIMHILPVLFSLKSKVLHHKPLKRVTPEEISKSDLDLVHDPGRNWIRISADSSFTCFNLEKIFRSKGSVTIREIHDWGKLQCFKTISNFYIQWYFLLTISHPFCMSLFQLSRLLTGSRPARKVYLHAKKSDITKRNYPNIRSHTNFFLFSKVFVQQTEHLHIFNRARRILPVFSDRCAVTASVQARGKSTVLLGYRH